MRILTILALVFVLGCSQADVQEKVVPPAPTPEEVTQPDLVEEVALPDPTPAAEPETVKTLQHGPPSYGEYGVATLEEMLASSEVIIRGRLASVRGVGVRSYRGVSGTPPDSTFEGYIDALEFTFDVLEYLKGSGGPTVTAVAYELSYHVEDTAEDAAASADWNLLPGRDKRWDSREAIVFLRKPPLREHEHLRSQLDHDYYLGITGKQDRQVTVASGEARAWLPDASSAVGERSASGGAKVWLPDASSAVGVRSASEQLFLLEDPVQATQGVAQRSVGQSSSTSSVSLSGLKAKLAAIEAEMAQGDGSQAYRDCIIATYFYNRPELYEDMLFEATVESGAPADTPVYTYSYAEFYLDRYGPTEPIDYKDTWLEGRDADLFGRRYPGHLYNKRPLPAGEYRSFSLARNHEMRLCQGDAWAQRGKFENVITVTAPEGTLAEAFFDPVADGTATTATTTVGTIRYEANTIKATLTPTVTNHILDFIALDGSVALSLDVADATTTDGVRSWTVRPRPGARGINSCCESGRPGRVARDSQSVAAWYLHPRLFSHRMGRPRPVRQPLLRGAIQRRNCGEGVWIFILPLGRPPTAQTHSCTGTGSPTTTGRHGSPVLIPTDRADSPDPRP